MWCVMLNVQRLRLPILVLKLVLVAITLTTSVTPSVTITATRQLENTFVSTTSPRFVCCVIVEDCWCTSLCNTLACRDTITVVALQMTTKVCCTPLR